MKKIKLFLFVLLVMIPFKVNAAIALRCAPDNAESGSEINCILYSPSSCYSFEGTLALPEGLSLLEVRPYSDFKFTGNGVNLSFSGPGNNAYEKIALMTIKTPTIDSDANFEIKIKKIKFKYLSSDKDFSSNDDLRSIIKLKAKTTTTTKKTTTTTTASTTTTTTKKVNFILTLDANGGNLDKQTVSCTPSGGTCDVDLSSINMPTRDNYTFKGWGINKECTSGTAGVVNLTGDLTYYACWSGESGVDKTILLNSLTIKDQEFVFNKDVFEYELKVDSDVTKLDVKAVAGEGIKVDISGNDNLTSGNNTIIITLTKGNAYNIYKINVLKNDGSANNVGDRTLSSLNINGYNLNFDSLIFNYSLKVENDTKVLDITPTLTNGNYTYEIIGNENLKNGSVIKIVITDLTNQTNTYSITIVKSNIFDEYKLYFMIGGAVIVCLIIYFIVGAKMKKNKQNKPNSVKVKNDDKKTEQIEVLNV